MSFIPSVMPKSLKKVYRYLNKHQKQKYNKQIIEYLNQQWIKNISVHQNNKKINKNKILISLTKLLTTFNQDFKEKF